MRDKIRMRSKFIRICALVLAGMFVAMTSMSISANDPNDWTIGGNAFGGGTTQSLGTTTNDDLQIVTGQPGQPGGTQRILIDGQIGTGHVGIGNPVPPGGFPQTRLHVDFATNPAANAYIEIARVGDVSPAVSKAVGMGVYGVAGDPAIQAIDQTNPEEYSWPLYINPKGTNTILNFEAGNVGIGQTTPETKLHVEGTITVDQKIRADDSGGLELATDEGTTRLFIKDDGNIGIGTTNPSQALHVAGNVRITGALYDSNNQPGTSGQILQTTGSGIDWVDLSPVPDDDWIISGDDMYSGVSGNVGMGIANPNYPLDIRASKANNNPIVWIENTYDGGNQEVLALNSQYDRDIGLSFYNQGTQMWRIWNDGGVENDNFKISNQNTDYMTILQSNGNIGFGDSNPDGVFEVNPDRDEDTRDEFVINSNGWVGIGTTSPGAKLEVYEHTNSNSLYQSARFIADTPFVGGGSYITLGESSYNNYNADIGVVFTQHTADIFFRPFDYYGEKAEAMRITGESKVGIGTTNPSHRLTVECTGTSGWEKGVSIKNTDSTSEAALSFNTASTGSNYWITGINDDTDYTIAYGNGFSSAYAKMVIQSGGNVGIGTTSPSNKLSVLGGADFSGNVGIGTTSPSNKLSVSGDADFSGNVGIGTMSPNNPLEIVSEDSPQFRIRHTDQVDYATFSVNTEGQLDITTVDGGGNNEGDICLMPDGNVGIGTTNPFVKLHVIGDCTLENGLLVGDPYGLRQAMLQVEHTNHPFPLKITNNGETQTYLLIDGSGRVGVGTSSPKGKLAVGDFTAISDVIFNSPNSLLYGSNIQFRENDEWSGFQIMHNTYSNRLHFASYVGAIKNNDIMTFDRSSGNVGIGTTNPSADLHVNSVLRLEPRTSAPSSASEGDIYVNSTNHHIYCYLNGAWKRLDN